MISGNNKSIIHDVSCKGSHRLSLLSSFSFSSVFLGFLDIGSNYQANKKRMELGPPMGGLGLGVGGGGGGGGIVRHTDEGCSDSRKLL